MANPGFNLHTLELAVCFQAPLPAFLTRVSHLFGGGGRRDMGQRCWGMCEDERITDWANAFTESNRI